MPRVTITGWLWATAALATELHAQVTPTDCRDRLAAIARDRGVPTAVIDSSLAQFQPDSSVLVARARQPEFVTPIWEYLGFLVDDERIQDGKNRLAEWRSVLDRIERDYLVDRHVVVAVWGIESDYGRTLGQRSLIRSLGTQACYGARRTSAIDQLVAALRIIAAGDVRAEDLVGSWAGAFGQTQFMPATFLTTAVDFDGDGRRDIMRSVPDALASAAKFLVRAGWQPGQPWGYEVLVPKGYRGPTGRRAARPMAAWAKAGVRPARDERLQGGGPASLLMPDGRGGPAFLVFANYRTFFAYNGADSYALAIGLLADRLAGGGPLMTQWSERGLSRVERREAQTLLASLGGDPGVADGAFGTRSREAVRRFQARVGLKPDGRVSGRVLDSLRAVRGRQP